MSMEQNLKKYIDEIIQEIESELDEATTTAGVDGYQTPFAFGGGRDSDEKKKKKTATQAGYTLAESFMADLDLIKKGSKDLTDFIKRVLTNKDFKDVKSDKEFHKYLKSFYNESVNEGMVSPKRGHEFFQLTKDTPIKYIKSSKSTTDAAGVLLKNKDGYIDGKKGAYLIDYFGSPYYVDLKKKFASKIYPMKEQDSLRYNSNFKEVDTAPEMSDWKKYLKESVNEGPIDRVIGGRPYQYVGDGRKGKAIVSGPMKDKDRNDIIKRAKKAGYKASPGIKGGVIIFIESVNEAKELTVNQVRKILEKEVQLLKKKYKNDYISKSDGKKELDKVKRKLGYNNKTQPDSDIEDVIDTFEDWLVDMSTPTNESVNEAKVKRPVNRWLELKNDETMHPHKKMAHGLKELKYQLAETEKFFKWYGKIKSMNELDSQNYWKRTNKHIYKIKERLVNIAKTLKEIEN